MTPITLAAALLLAAPAPQTPAAQTPATLDQRFDAMDANKDGRIERAEYAAFMQAKFSRQAQEMDAAFATMDKDRNGQLSKAEAAANPVIASVFAALDADKSGTLSKAEMQQALKQSQAAESAAQ